MKPLWWEGVEKRRRNSQDSSLEVKIQARKETNKELRQGTGSLEDFFRWSAPFWQGTIEAEPHGGAGASRLSGHWPSDAQVQRLDGESWASMELEGDES
jgi:hypothetical protein